MEFYVWFTKTFRFVAELNVLLQKNNDKILTIEHVLGHANLLSDLYLIHRRGQFIFENPHQYFARLLVRISSIGLVSKVGMFSMTLLAAIAFFNKTSSSTNAFTNLIGNNVNALIKLYLIGTASGYSVKYFNYECFMRWNVHHTITYEII